MRSLISILVCSLILVSYAYSENVDVLGEKLFRSGDFEKAREVFNKSLSLDNLNPQTHYFLGLIEYEEGNIEKAKTRFQIAHECLIPFNQDMSLLIDNNNVHLEFPDNYEVRVYYKDGWYIVPKDPAAVNSKLHSLESGSNYKIRLKTPSVKSFNAKVIIVSLIAFSFFLAR